MSTKLTKRNKKVLLSIDADSPVDLYWLNRANLADKPPSEGDKTIICEQFWDEFIIICKAVFIRNPEADLFDVFNFIRENFLGGWTMLEDSTFIVDIDSQIEREYQKGLRNAG